MDVFLTLFPEGALAHSVTTCVWVGVFIVVTCNLRFGWVLSGLVVPGYLAPLVFLKPWAAGVVMFEAALTYLIVYAFSEKRAETGLLSRITFWGSLFGRDRFFALVIVSIGVRLVFDTWLLPEAAVWLEQRFDVAVDFRNNLHSFGLIIICLLANQFWKTGLLRGLIPVGVPILLTCLVVRFVLMEFTNFSIGNLSYIYEDVAASLLASPKAYMILVLAAFIASRMNLHYGWDFNGILIPALLALQWYQPEKILISFLEAGVILVVANAVLKIPWLSHVNIEGGRKLLLFFNISFAYKLLVGWSVLWLDLDVRATDYYGFGYLLPTLIAIKMHDKDIVARLGRATLQTSLTAVVVASVLAFVLARIDWRDPADRIAETTPAAPIERTWKPLPELLKNETLGAYRHRSANAVNKPLATEVDRFTAALELLSRSLRQGADAAAAELLADAAALLTGLNFEVIEHPDWILLRERQPSLGWGTFALARQPARSLALEVPAPLEDGHLSHISAHLFELYGAATLAIAGSHLRLNRDQDPIATLDQTSLFQAFHRFTAQHDVMQLRGLTPTNKRILGQDRDAEPRSELRLDGRIPEHLNLATLQRLVGVYHTRFETPTTPNVQRQTASAGFAELYLTNGSVRQLLYAALAARDDSDTASSSLLRPEYLTEWLNTARRQFAAKGSNSYAAMSQPELLYFDEQVLTPMLNWASAHGASLRCNAGSRTECRLRDGALRELAAIDDAASVVRHRVALLHGDPSDPMLTLAPDDTPPVRPSAVVVLRPQEGSAQIVQAPRPLTEPGSLEFAVRLFDDMAATALIVSGTHSAANADGSADVLRIANKGSLFNLASQRMVRTAGSRPMRLVQVRGLAPQALPAKAGEVSDDPGSGAPDVLISRRFVPLGETAPDDSDLDRYLEEQRLVSRTVDGSVATIGYENHLVLQNRYLEQSAGKSFVTLWVSPGSRQALRHQSGNRQLLAQLSSLGLAPEKASLSERLANAHLQTALDPELERLLQDYQRSADVMVLADALDRYPQRHFEALLDRRTQQIYLLVGARQQQIAGAFLLGNGAGAGRRVVSTHLADPVAISGVVDDFVTRRDARLTFEDPT